MDKIKILNQTNINSLSDILKITNQIYVSPALYSFKSRVKKIYNLIDYNSKITPCIFFGVYIHSDIKKIHNHNTLKIIIWGGSDVYPKNIISLNKHNNNIINIAISTCIYTRLLNSNIKSILVDFNMVDTSLFFPISSNELGNKILIYNGQQQNRESLYGKEIYEQIVSSLPNYIYIYSNTLNVPYELMPSIYKTCFIVLRLTQYDGNANTAQECDAMNIPIIHNQSTNGLKWTTLEDIINYILFYDTKL